MIIFQLKYSFKYLVLKISKDVLSLISFDILFQRLHVSSLRKLYGPHYLIDSYGISVSLMISDRYGISVSLIISDRYGISVSLMISDRYGISVSLIISSMCRSHNPLFPYDEMNNTNLAKTCKNIGRTRKFRKDM
jgi:hypothetical protein